MNIFDCNKAPVGCLPCTELCEVTRLTNGDSHKGPCTLDCPSELYEFIKLVQAQFTKGTIRTFLDFSQS